MNENDFAQMLFIIFSLFCLFIFQYVFLIGNNSQAQHYFLAFQVPKNGIFIIWLILFKWSCWTSSNLNYQYHSLCHLINLVQDYRYLNTLTILSSFKLTNLFLDLSIHPYLWTFSIVLYLFLKQCQQKTGLPFFQISFYFCSISVMELLGLGFKDLWIIVIWNFLPSFNPMSY